MIKRAIQIDVYFTILQALAEQAKYMFLIRARSRSACAWRITK